MTQEQESRYEYNTSLSSLESLFWNETYYDYSPATIKKWLKDPMQHNKQLRYLSRKLYSSNGIYSNVLDYMVSLPTLDRVIYSSNKSHSRFKKNRELFIEALRKLKDRQITRDILLKLGIEGVSFAYFETSGTPEIHGFLSDVDVQNITEINASNFNCSVVPLPTDYCAIVGRKNGSYVMAFDLSFFDQFTGNGRSLRLKKYPKEIREKYSEYRKDSGKRWAILDNNKTIVNKIRANIDEKWGRPIGLSAFIDILYDEYFTETKRAVLDELNSQIVYQTFPEGEHKGISSLSQKQQEQQHNNIKNALFAKGNRKGINFFSVAAGTKLDKIDTNIEILKTKTEDELLKRIATDLGFAGSALNGEDGNFSSQQTNIELVTRQILSWLEQIQDEYNKVINANIIQDKQCFVEMYYLPTTIANRDQMVGYMKDLYTQGRGSLQAWIAATGWNPEAYQALMDYEIEEDWENKYPVHAISYTQGNEDKKGAPESDSQNPNTLKSKSSGSNQNPRAN